MARSCRSPSKMSIPEEFIEEAMSEMQRRPAVCVFCGLAMTIKVLDEHYETCEFYPIPCPYKCGQKELPRNQMRQHLEECPLCIFVCEFSDLGCNYQGLEKDVLQHKREKMVHHLDLLCESHYCHKTASDVALGKLAANLKEKAAANSAAIRNLEKKISDLNDEIKKIHSDTKITKTFQDKRKQEILDNLAEFKSAKVTVNTILDEGMREFENARGRHVRFAISDSVNEIFSTHINKLSASAETLDSTSDNND